MYKASSHIKQLDDYRVVEHQKVRSRLTGKEIEIKLGPTDNKKVPANPWASKSQQKFGYANPEKFGGKDKLAEWSAHTDFKHLPERVKKK